MFNIFFRILNLNIEINMVSFQYYFYSIVFILKSVNSFCNIFLTQNNSLYFRFFNYINYFSSGYFNFNELMNLPILKFFYSLFFGRLSTLEYFYYGSILCLASLNWSYIIKRLLEYILNELIITLLKYLFYYIPLFLNICLQKIIFDINQWYSYIEIGHLCLNCDAYSTKECIVDYSEKNDTIDSDNTSYLDNQPSENIEAKKKKIMEMEKKLVRSSINNAKGNFFSKK